MLNQFSDDELKTELERRETVNRPRPQPVTDPDFSTVKRYCIDYINELYKQGRVNDDAKHYIFEAAIEAVYREKVWEFIRSFS